MAHPFTRTVVLIGFLCFLNVAEGFQALPTYNRLLASVVPLYAQEDRKRLQGGYIRNDDGGHYLNRRDVMSTFPFVGGSVALSTMLSLPTSAIADDGGASASKILLRLKSIPTFCIVNADGIPYMIFDGQASATGYFFLSFNVAAGVLRDAKDKDTNAEGKWDEATIITVPLTAAMKLGLTKVQRTAINNGIKFDSYNDIVPSEEGVNDAKLVDKSNPEKWMEKGRVPLFFLKGLEVDGGLSPRYFNKADLLAEWNRQNPGKDPPPIQLAEMVDLFRNGLGGQLEKLQNIILIPVRETVQVAVELKKKQPKDLTYSVKEVYLVQSTKG